MLEIDVLGPLQVRLDGDPIAVPAGAQSRVLHALAVWRQVSVSRLTSVLWDDNPPAAADSSLQAHVSRLRRVVGTDRIVRTASGYELTDTTVDVERLRALAEGDDQDLRTAAGLIRGTPLADVADVAAFAGVERSLVELVLATRLRFAEARAAGGDVEAAIADLELIVDEEPLHEAAWISLARTLHLAHRQGDAIAALDRCRRRLADDGLSPSADFETAEDAIFVAPGRLPTMGRTTVRRRRSRFIGRAAGLGAIADALAEHRLVTLVGPGGMGKTRLAEEAALAWSEQHSGTAILVELATVSRPEAVPNAIGRACGVRSAGDPITIGIQALGPGRSLLILDNCEHLLDEAAAAIETILEAGRTTIVVATSREPIGLEGERVIPVGPLDEAIDLFWDRAALTTGETRRTDSKTVIDLCERLDRMPLAIEMAASRMRSMSPTELLAAIEGGTRLAQRGGDARHRTLETLIEWSYELLSHADREAFRSLGVMASRFDIDSAAIVLDTDPTEARETLARLCDRSMVQAHRHHDGTRYSLLETLRSYALERLNESDDSDLIRDRQARAMVDLAERAGRDSASPEEGRWNLRIREAMPDIARAHRRLRGDGAAQARLIRPLFPYAYFSMPPGLPELATLTTVEWGHLDHPDIPTAFAMAAVGAINAGDLEWANTLLDRGLAHPQGGQAWETWFIAADLAIYEGRLTDAAAAARMMIEASVGVLIPIATVGAHSALALAAAYSGNEQDGLVLANEGCRMAEGLGSPSAQALAEYSVGEILHSTEPDQALVHLERARELSAAGRTIFVAVIATATIASTLARLGRTDEAASEYLELIELSQSLGDMNHLWTGLRNLVELFVARDAPLAAATLLGATTGRVSPTYGAEAELLAEAARQLEERLGADYANAHGNGAGFTPSDTIDFARTTLETLT